MLRCVGAVTSRGVVDTMPHAALPLPPRCSGCTHRHPRPMRALLHACDEFSVLFVTCNGKFIVFVVRFAH